MLKAPLYGHDVTTLKVYGYGEHKKVKLTTHKILRNKGVECDKLRSVVDKGGEKCEENILRAKAKIFELAFCNPWDYFFTGTLDPKKYDRQNLEKFQKDLSQYIRDVRKNGHDIQYLLIPELHKDGKSWHMHGFFRGIPAEQLHLYRLGDRMNKSLAEKVRDGQPVYDWLPYTRKFGFSSLEPIRNEEAVSKYCTKYITKDLASCVKRVGAHMYYRSNGLKEAELIAKGTLTAYVKAPDYANEYVAVSWFDFDMLDTLDSLIIRQTTM